MAVLETEGDLQFEDLPSAGSLKVTKLITSPEGKKLRAVVTNSHILLTIESTPPHTIVVTGDAPVTIDLLGQIGDILGDALTGLVKLLTCRPITTTTVETHKDGTVTVVTQTMCAPS